jgi:hypothetical protein
MRESRAPHHVECSFFDALQSCILKVNQSHYRTTIAFQAGNFKGTSDGTKFELFYNFQLLNTETIHLLETAVREHLAVVRYVLVVTLSYR